MKKLEITVEGNSQIANVFFLENNLYKQLPNKRAFNEVNWPDRDADDFIDEIIENLITENKKHAVHLGRGFCRKNNPVIEIMDNGKCLYEGMIYRSRPYYKDDSLFKNETDIEYDDVISGDSESSLEADAHFFSIANNFTYCMLEKTECFSANSLVTIEVEDDFKLSDLNVIFMNINTGNEGSITQLIYSDTGLEEQVYGIRYKGVFYEFQRNNESIGSNELLWYEKIGDSWAPSINFSNKIEELKASF